jgi:methylase of polypeptide subunit release factors
VVFSLLIKEEFKKVFRRTLVFILAFSFIIPPSFAQQLIPVLSGQLPAAVSRPLHIRSIFYDSHSGDLRAGLDGQSGNESEELQTHVLLSYFFTGIVLPNSAFWVNLRPGSADAIMDKRLASTDAGRILLEADIQLKKDLALRTSPDSPQGAAYWERLYKKAEELFGSVPQSLPTVSRPWIVPDQIILRTNGREAYIYKATLKVQLESDRLGAAAPLPGDPRFKELNEFSASLMRELILPGLSRDINCGSAYAQLRQVFYSLIIAQSFKARFSSDPRWRTVIDSADLSGLNSRTPWSKEALFRQYEQSFSRGEYGYQQQMQGVLGNVTRSYTSGGVIFTGLADGGVAEEVKGNPAVNLAETLLQHSCRVSGFPGYPSFSVSAADGGENQLIDRKWYQDDIAAHASSIIYGENGPREFHSVFHNGLWGANTRGLVSEGENIFDQLLAARTGQRGKVKVLDLGAAGGVEAGQMFVKGQQAGLEMQIDTVSLSPIAPRLRIKKSMQEIKALWKEKFQQDAPEYISLESAIELQNKGWDIFELLAAPFVNRQYIGAYSKADIRGTYDYIHDQWGPFFHKETGCTLDTYLAKTLPLLEKEGILYVASSASFRMAEVPADFIVVKEAHGILERYLGSLIGFRKDSDVAKHILPGLKYEKVSPGGNYYEVESLEPCINALRDGGMNKDVIKQTGPGALQPEGMLSVKAPSSSGAPGSLNRIMELFGLDQELASAAWTSKAARTRKEFTAGMTVKRLDLGKSDSPEIKYLQNELCDNGYLVKSIDLMYDQSERLIAIFPAASETLRDEKLRFLNLSYYNYRPPQIGSPHAAEKWQEIARAVTLDRWVIDRYLEFMFAQKEMAAANEDRSVYVHARLDKATKGYTVGGLSWYDPFRRSMHFEPFPEPEISSDQIVTMVLPTVYSPADVDEYDHGYYEALCRDFELNPGDECEVIGPGAGLELWIGALRTGRPVAAIGINPFEVENTRLTAAIGGFEAEVIQGDNIIDENGVSRFPGRHFDRVLWNMPSATPESTSRNHFGFYGRLKSLWDGDPKQDTLRRFAFGLTSVLGENGRALIWNQNEQGYSPSDPIEGFLKTGGESAVEFVPSQHKLDVRVELPDKANDSVRTYFVSRPGQQRDGGISETTVVGEVLRLFGFSADFQNLRRVSPSRKVSFEGHRIVRVSLGAGNSQALRYLKNELADLGEFIVTGLDMMYSPSGQLQAIFPVISTQQKSARNQRIRFLNLAYYNFRVPRIGEPEAVAAWQEIIRVCAEERAVMKRYIAAVFPGIEVSAANEELAVFIYAEVDKTTGAFAMKGLSTAVNGRSARSAFPEPDASKFQIVIPVLPTVFPPAADEQTLGIVDQGYYKALCRDFGLRKGDDCLVTGSGTGLEAWICACKTGARVYAIDINPLAVANTRLTAQIGGFEVTAITGDNIITQNGISRFGEKCFDRIMWNMPSLTYKIPFFVQRRLQGQWDGDRNGDTLKRFAAGLNKSLKSDGTALVWNTIAPFSPDTVAECMTESRLDVKVKVEDEITRTYFISKPAPAIADGGVTEAAPISEVMKLFGLSGLQATGEKEYKGRKIAIIKLAAADSPEREYLKNELLDQGEYKLTELELMYDKAGRPSALFPSLPAEMREQLKRGVCAQRTRFLNLSYYNFRVPKIGEPGADEAWGEIARTVSEERKVMQRYAKKMFGENGAAVANESRPVFVYAEIDKATGAYTIKGLSKASEVWGTRFAPALPRKDGTKHQIVTVVLPTVYSPGDMEVFDQGYYEFLARDFELRKGDECLVVGSGTGLEAWICAVRTGQKVYAIGINPFEIANTRFTARLGGFDINAIVGDNITDDRGNPRFAGKRFARVTWNMPSAASVLSRSAYPGRLRAFWDVDPGGQTARRFARGLNSILADDGKALVWNVCEQREFAEYLDLTGMLMSGGETEFVPSESRQKFKVTVKRPHEDNPVIDKRVATYIVERRDGGGADLPVVEVMKLFGLNDIPVAGETEFEGRKIARFDLGSSDSQELRYLKNELLDPGETKVEALELMYDSAGRPSALFPVLSPGTPGMGNNGSSQKTRFLNLSYYNFRMPRIGEAGADAAWQEITRTVTAERAVMQRYIENFRPEIGMTAANETQSVYIYAEIGKAIGSYTTKGLSTVRAASIDFEAFPSKVDGAYQIVTMVLPTVYSHVNREDTDRGYFAVLCSWLWRYHGEHSLVVGSGTGLEGWILSCLNGGKIYAIDINPLAEANTRLTAKLGGFKITTMTADNVTDQNGAPRFTQVQFDRVVWNMPSASSDNRELFSGRLKAWWDGDPGGASGARVLRRFARGLREILKKEGTAIVWNQPVPVYIGDEQKDLVEELFKTGGESEFQGSPYQHKLDVAVIAQDVINRTYSISLPKTQAAAQDGGRGGIDLTVLASNAAPVTEGVTAGSYDEREWRQVERMVNAGLLPAAERLERLFHPSAIKGKGPRALVTLARLLRLQESTGEKTEAGMISCIGPAEAECCRNY